MLKKIAYWCDRILGIVISIFTVLMVLIAGAQILFRAVFNMPLSWSEEVATYLFVWWVYMGAMLAVRSKSHLGIDVFVRRLPPLLAKINILFIYLCMFGFLVFMFKLGIFLVKSTMNDLTPVTGFPVGIIFLIQPLCAICMIIFIIEILIEEVRGPDSRS
jgi:TRAP-type C4-dicarboxylate transport system permease small subunit